MPRARIPERPLTVLVVDGYPDAADSLVTLLALEGFAAGAAWTGGAALAAAAAAPPDVVVLEPRTPGGGWGLAALLGEAVGGKRPLVVAVTTDATPAGRRAGAAAGVDLYLVKPADPDALVRILRRFACAIGSTDPPSGHRIDFPPPRRVPGGAAPIGRRGVSPERATVVPWGEPVDSASAQREVAMKLFVANLTADTTAADLAELLAPFGAVESADVWVSEGAPPVPRVGYVVLSAGGAAAVAALNGVRYRGLELVVSEVPPRGEAFAPESTRRDAYAALVADRDRGSSVVRSRGRVAHQFGLTREQVAAIEREGAVKRWSPARSAAAW